MTVETDALGILDRHPEAGRIRSRRLNKGVATLIVDASGLRDADRSKLERELHDAASAIEGVDEVRIAMTASQPHRTLIAVGSGKGGVGKSTVAANLAIALARSGKKVGLVDADVYGPSQPTLLGSDTKPTAEDDRLIPVEAQGLKFLSLGHLVSPGHALAWRGPMATGALAKLVDADWGDAEVLVVDLPPGTGDVQLTMLQRFKPAGAIIISTPQDLALMDAIRALQLFEQGGVPVIGMVENMAGYACPHCGEVSDPFGQGGAEAAAKAMGHAFLGRVPLDLSIRQNSDAGNPPAAGEGPQAEAFAAIARRVATWLDNQR